MEGEYKSTMQKKELYLREERVTCGAGYYTKMLQYNRVPGVLPFVAEPTEEHQQYRYEIGTKRALTECREYDKMNHAQIEKLVRGVAEVIENGREYLIHEGDYVLQPEYIFLATDSEKVYLCCYPALQSEVRQQLAGLFEYLLSHIDYQDFAAVGMAYELYMKSKESGCCFADLLEVLARHGEREEDVPEEVNAQGEMKRAELEQGCERSKKTEKLKESETVQEVPGYCLRAETVGDSLKITSLPCYITIKGELMGEDEGAPVLGKTQARISLQRESVYIEDMKSGNGTYVNGRRIAGNEIHKLNLGDSVMLADRCYRFVRTG